MTSRKQVEAVMQSLGLAEMQAINHVKMRNELQRRNIKNAKFTSSKSSSFCVQ